MTFAGVFVEEEVRGLITVPCRKLTLTRPRWSAGAPVGAPREQLGEDGFLSTLDLKTGARHVGCWQPVKPCASRRRSSDPMNKCLILTDDVGRLSSGAKDYPSSFASSDEALANILKESNRYYQIVDRHSMRAVQRGPCRVQRRLPGEPRFGRLPPPLPL